jgi:hypothetical protein
MGASKPLGLIVLASKCDWRLVPQLEQVLIIISGLSQICELEKPENLPDKKFRIKPCPLSEIEDVHEGVSTRGIDFFGQYDPEEMTVTLQMCLMKRFAGSHGFHLEDVLTIVLIHELAHFVTHLGVSDSANRWVAFENRELIEAVEDIAQQATNLYLRVARYGPLVQVFESLSIYSPRPYQTWRDAWMNHFRNKDASFQTAIRDFQHEVREARKKESVTQVENSHEISGYD